MYFERDLSQRQIALRTGMARASVPLIMKRLEASGLSWQEALQLSDLELGAQLYPEPPGQPAKP